jgi:hypothetical protein
VNQRGRDLSTIMGGQLAWVGPGVRLLSVSELMAWQTLRMEVVDDARLSRSPRTSTCAKRRSSGTGASGSVR